MSDYEKGEGVSATTQQLPIMEKENARQGYILDAEDLGVEASGLKTASDGHTVLIPQPSDDPNDPLNWSSWKKNSILLTISFLAFLPDFGTAMGSVTQISQAKTWHIPVATIQQSVAINTMLSGVSGIFVVICSSYFGRAPTLFWTRLIAIAGVIWYAMAGPYHSFYAARIVVGFFVGTAQTVCDLPPLVVTQSDYTKLKAELT